MLNDAERARIADAVGRAETATSGEIACVVTERVSAYREVPLAWAAAVAVLAPPVAATLGLRLDLLAAPFQGWTAAHGQAGAGPLLTVYAVLQVVLFAATAILVSAPPVLRRLTPRALKQRRVRATALQHFAAARKRLAPDRPLVVIFAALSERQMEVVADAAIHAKVGQPLWDRAVAEALAAVPAGGPAAGLVKAIEICGAALTEHFPDDGRANAFPDAALEL